MYFYYYIQLKVNKIKLGFQNSKYERYKFVKIYYYLRININVRELDFLKLYFNKIVDNFSKLI